MQKLAGFLKEVGRVLVVERLLDFLLTRLLTTENPKCGLMYRRVFKFLKDSFPNSNEEATPYNPMHPIFNGVLFAFLSPRFRGNSRIWSIPSDREGDLRT